MWVNDVVWLGRGNFKVTVLIWRDREVVENKPDIVNSNSSDSPIESSRTPLCPSETITAFELQ